MDKQEQSRLETMDHAPTVTDCENAELKAVKEVGVEREIKEET